MTDLFNFQKQFLRNKPAQVAPLMLGQISTPPAYVSPKTQMYQQVLSRLRLVMISKMAKPEEIIIVEDDCGNIVREKMQDTDAIAVYRTMREALVYLTNLDTQDTQDHMLFKLQKQVDGSEWSWNNLNTLCWAVGSISGTMVSFSFLLLYYWRRSVFRAKHKNAPFWCM